MATLHERLQSVSELYRLRNAMYLRGEDRSRFLYDGVRYFGKLLRKSETDKKILAQALASVFSRTCAIADSYIDLPIIDGLCQKYPIQYCAYCTGFPCHCPPNRTAQIQLASVDSQQKQWSIKKWCEHMDQVYGEKNRALGISSMFARLNEEISEAENIQLVEIHNRSLSLTDARRRAAREFADVFAWIFAISAYLELDLDTAVEERYCRNCKRCNGRPCHCGPIYFYSSRANPGSQVGDVVRTVVADQEA